MHEIELDIKIRSAKNKVFTLLKDFERFAEFMKFVKKVKILDNQPAKVISLWEIEIDGAPLSWRQEDTIDDKNSEIRFRMTEGDYQQYEGKWQLLEIDKDNTRMIVSAKFDWGIPVLEEYVKDKLERNTKLAISGMLRAIKKRAEQNV